MHTLCMFLPLCDSDSYATPVRDVRQPFLRAPVLSVYWSMLFVTKRKIEPDIESEIYSTNLNMI